MKRVLTIASVADLLFVAILLHSVIKDFFWTHPWWHSFLVAVPTVALPVLAYFELHHSSEANALRGRIADLTAELDAERNTHLQQIAENTKKPVTQAERNAALLRSHIGARVRVSEEHGNWGDPPMIAEVSDDNIVTLFTPRGFLTSTAWCVNVHCDDLQIVNIPEGSCPLRIKVLRRFGPDVPLGEITKWEARNQPRTAPAVLKGPNVYRAAYTKAGSSEARSLNVYVAQDGSNSFVLEASTGGTFTSDNVGISKQFMLLQVEYEAEGFRNASSGTGASPHRLFIRTIG